MARKLSKTAPRIDPLALINLGEGRADDLVPDADLDGLRFERVEVPSNLAGITLLECELADCSASQLGLRGARLLEARISRIAVPSLAAQGSSWRDCELIDSRIGAIEAGGAELRRVVVEGSKLGWVNLREADVSDVVFKNCTFDEIDFGGATAARVAFENCVTDKLTLTRATAEHLDLRGLEFRAIEGLEGLRGAILTHEQVAYMAETLAAHVGITIES